MKLFTNCLLFVAATICCIILFMMSCITSTNAKRLQHSEPLHLHHHHRHHPLHSLSSNSASPSCPCPSDPSLCAPLKTPLPEKEFLMFQTNSLNWKTYDFRYVTSIALFDGYGDPTMLCGAHEKGTRILYATDGVPPDQLFNATARSVFIANAVRKVQENFWDGINLDFEYPLPKGSQEESDFTTFTQELGSALKKAIPTSSFSLDVAWSTHDIDGRNYNYDALVSATDFVAIMDYDTRSQVFSGPPCWAGPNSPAETLFQGVASFLQLKSASKKKLVLGLPWYGYTYECINAANNNNSINPATLQQCQIESVPFRNVSCSDAAGGQIIFSDIMKIARNKSQAISPVITNVSMEQEGSFATFNYYNSDNTNHNQPLRKMYFDNPDTLREKYRAAKDLGLRGLAIWSVDMIYVDPKDKESKYDAEEMWNAFGAFL